MKNNTNKLIFEELKKASLLFNYDPKKTLSENIVEQTVGDKKFNFTPNPEVGKGGITYNPTSPADMLKNAQTAVAGALPAGATPSENNPEKYKEFFAQKLKDFANLSGTTASGTTASGATASGATSGATSGTTSGTTAPTSVLITKNDNAYEYKMENGKYYFKGKTGTKFATKYPDWKESKAPKGIAAIKALFDKNPKGDTPVEVNTQTPTDNSEKYKEFFAQKLKDAQNLPKTLPGVQGGETPKQQNDGITDDNSAANNTSVQGQIQGTISDDEEV